MILKLYVDLKGSHYHVRVFAGPDSNHLALCGELRMLPREYEAFSETLRAGVPTTSATVLIKEQPALYHTLEVNVK
jgi:hypothetical protein